MANASNVCWPSVAGAPMFAEFWPTKLKPLAAPEISAGRRFKPRARRASQQISPILPRDRLPGNPQNPAPESWILAGKTFVSYEMHCDFSPKLANRVEASISIGFSSRTRRCHWGCCRSLATELLKPTEPAFCASHEALRANAATDRRHGCKNGVLDA